MGGFPPAARAAIRERARDRCEWCGGEEGQPPGAFGRWFDFHHRRLKGQGGTSDPSINDPANGAAVHHACHVGPGDTVHGRPAKARERGLIVSKLGEVAPWRPEGVGV